MASLSDQLVQKLLKGRYIASFGSESPDGSVHVVAVWFWSDGARIYVATSKRTRKARNIEGKSRASIMIDARDPAASCGVNIAGAARMLTGEASRKWNELVHRKYLSEAALADSRVGPIFAGWDDVTIEVTPEAVVAWDMREADRQVFGGVFASNPSYLLPTER
jgi:general stress protein 26